MVKNELPDVQYLNQDYEEVQIARVFRFEKEGDKIEGKLLAKEPIKTQFRDNYIYRISTKDGEYSIFGTAELNLKLRNVPINSDVIIIYIGKVRSKSGLWMKSYKVLVKK